MIRFPRISGRPQPKQGKMTLREYARFSEQCLKSNSRITPENCLQTGLDEAAIRKRFDLKGK